MGAGKEAGRVVITKRCPFPRPTRSEHGGSSGVTAPRAPSSRCGGGAWKPVNEAGLGGGGALGR